MSMLDDVELAPTQAVEPPPPPRMSRVGPILSLALFAGMVAGFWVYRARQTAPAETQPSSAVAPPRLKPTPLAPNTPAVALPPLDQLDPFIRDTLSGITKAPIALAWLATNHLTEQFVAIVQGTAEGQAPMRMLAPGACSAWAIRSPTAESMR